MATQTDSAPVRLDGERIFHPCACGNEEFTRNPRYHFAHCEVVRCSRCGLMRTFPEPSAESLAVIYSQETEKYSLAVAEDESRQALFDPVFLDILKTVERYAPQKGRILDVGCNLGDLMFAARERGWEAEGVDVNEANIRHLRAAGFTAYDDFLERLDLPDNHYDALVANQLLEHVPEPTAFLACVRRILRPGGVVFIGVPCFESPIPTVLKRDAWYALLPEEHIWQFGEASLKRLITESGFRVAEYYRGCSDFAGRPTVNPKTWLRYALYKSLAATPYGDFSNLIGINEK